MALFLDWLWPLLSLPLPPTHFILLEWLWWCLGHEHGMPALHVVLMQERPRLHEAPRRVQRHGGLSRRVHVQHVATARRATLQGHIQQRTYRTATTDQHWR